MGNAFDYLKWRGDITFDKDGFNDVDNVIMASMSYVEFKGIVPGFNEDRTITIKEASKRFFEIHSEEELAADTSLIKDIPLLLREVAKTKRFGNARLSNYYEKNSIEEEQQFGAVTIELSDETAYISFRGTDDSIVGWKEDFNMSFMTVPSQGEAVEYLEKTAKVIYKKLRLGGHSKGGNLAIYAAAMSPYNVRRKIDKVYCNDGPGFMSSLADTEGYKDIKDRIMIFVPQDSVVGMLFEHGEKYKVVESSNKGVFQHDALSWQVIGNKLILLRKRSNASIEFEKTVKEWLKPFDEKKRQEFVRDFFGVIEATGAKTLSELNAGGIKSMVTIFKSFTAMDMKTKEMMAQMFIIFKKCL